MEFFKPVELWREFTDTDVAIVAIVGALIGVAIYLHEAFIRKPGNNPALSDYIFLFSVVSVTIWWIISAQELTERVPIQ